MALGAPVRRARLAAAVAGVAAHRAIVLSPTMRRQGVGVTRGRFGGREATIWVLHAGRLALPGTQLPDIQLP